MASNTTSPGTALMTSASMAPAPGTPAARMHLKLPPRPVHYALKRQAVQAAWITRAVESSSATARLVMSGRASGSSLELLRMQQTVLKELHALGEDWFKGVATWTQECTELKAANTMSKVVEQEFDLIGQFNQLVTDQMTALVNLMERAQVGYSFWVQQKLDS